jgi:hypothetical protein
MSKIKKYQYGERVTYFFQCPACDTVHSFNQSWSFNDDYEKPTVSPSLLVTNGNENYRCHSFVTDGRIEYQGDCLHSMAGMTIDLPDINES